MRRAWGWIRVVLALALLALIGAQLSSWPLIWQTLQRAEPQYLVGCVLIYAVGVWLSCIKWRMLLAVQGHRLPITQLIHWYLLGALAGNLLPSSIGGDLGRAYVAGRAIGSQADAWVSIAAERMAGLVTLVVLAAGVLLFAPALLGWSPLIPLLALAAGAGAAILLVLVLRNMRRWAWLPAPVRTLTERLQAVLAHYRSASDAITAALTLSLAFHLLNAASTWLVARAVAPQAGLQVLLVYPLIDLAGLVPLAPGGLGIRDGAMAVLLSSTGLTADQALAAALLSRALLVIVSLSGLPALLAEWRTAARQ
jgi:glycosyltransferase 2 family protein